MKSILKKAPGRETLFGLILTSLIVAPSLAQDLPKGVRKVASVEGITEYNLENGLKVLMFPDLPNQR